MGTNTRVFKMLSCCRMLLLSIVSIVSVAAVAEIKELTDTTMASSVTNSAHHTVVLWRGEGLANPDETVRAFEDATRQFENQPEFQFAYVDTNTQSSLVSLY